MKRDRQEFAQLGLCDPLVDRGRSPSPGVELIAIEILQQPRHLVANIGLVICSYWRSREKGLYADKAVS
jgi:hypothetical protein